jgi:hypothetical protein
LAQTELTAKCNQALAMPAFCGFMATTKSTESDMSSKAPADGASPAPRQRVRKAAAKSSAATPVPAAPATTPEAAATPAAEAGAQRRIGGGWLAVGVGSAALVAALLFATRGKRNDWSK